MEKIILEKKQELDILRSGSNWDKARRDLVILCIKHRLPYKQIGELLGISRQRVFQIYSYEGLEQSGRVKDSLRADIISRENNMCLICRKEGTQEKPLDVHHIGNPQIKDKSNLVSLCRSCHRRVDNTKRKSVQNLTNV